MQNFTTQRQGWSADDLSQAMLASIEQSGNPRYIKRNAHMIHFNGFWRQGNRQNVCAWLDKATWHDAKTGQGGGCKEFAKVAFGLSLPEFMNRFGCAPRSKVYGRPKVSEAGNKYGVHLKKPVHDIWLELCKRDRLRDDKAAQWLAGERGFKDPRTWIGSGFANLDKGDIELFELVHYNLISQRLSLGPQLVAPIRGVHSDVFGNVKMRRLAT